MINSLFSSSNKTINIYKTRKIQKSKNPVAAFFQQPAKEQKKAWKKIIRRANEMQREIMEK